MLWYLETRLHRRRREGARRARARVRGGVRRAADALAARRAAAHRQLGRRRSRRQSLRHARRHDRRRAPRELRRSSAATRTRSTDLVERLSRVGAARAAERRAARVARGRPRAAARRVGGEPAPQRRRAAAAQAVASWRRASRRRAGSSRRATPAGVAEEPAAYPHAAEFEHDLAARAREPRRAPARRTPCATTSIRCSPRVRAHGFHGFMMDVRDHADVTRAALADIAQQLGLARSTAHALRARAARPPPAGRARTCRSPTRRRACSTPSRAIRTIQDEIGEARREHVHRLDDDERRRSAARAAARRARWGSSISPPTPPQSSLDVVPLFETLDDLERAPVSCAPCSTTRSSECVRHPDPAAREGDRDGAAADAETARASAGSFPRGRARGG